MTVEIFDAAQRRYAASTGRPVWRVAHALVTVAPDSVAVRATDQRGRYVVARRGQSGLVAAGGELLDALAAAGIDMDRDSPPQILVADPGTVTTLTELARVHAAADDPTRAAAAEAVAWCCERADFPGSSALVDLTELTAVAMVAGVPASRDRVPATWHVWLDLPDDPVAATFAWAGVLAGRPSGPHSWSGVLADDDAESWRYRREAVAGGWCHASPERLARAAVGLRERCNAADVWDSVLLSDPWWRRRAVHTGHVVVGTASIVPGVSGFRVESPRLDARLAAGTEVTGWTGVVDTVTFNRFFSTVRSARVEGQVLALTCDKAKHSPGDGDPVTVMVAPPSPSLHTSVRIRMYQKYAARGSWIARADAPIVARRDVPLDVMISAAEDD